MIAVITLLASLFLASIETFLYNREVIQALGMSFASILALVFFVMQTEKSFTLLKGLALVNYVILIIFGILVPILHDYINSVAYAALAAFLFSSYRVINASRVLKVHKNYDIFSNEYIFASLTLYLDFVNFLYYIVSFLGLSRKR
ncbi:UNVERIFIED_CONTAM: hypothetical protein RMT77_010440 [Armadillidium vulgare]